jgi:hypothetical protein
VDLGDAAMLGMAEPADRGDDIEAELVLWQRESPLRLGAEADAAAWALGGAAVTDLEVQADDPVQGRDRPPGEVGRPGRPAAGGTGPRPAGQLEGAVGLGAGTPSRHVMTPRSSVGSRSNNRAVLDQ